MAYEELNCYIKKALKCIENLDYKLFFSLTEELSNKIKDENFRAYLQEILKDRPEAHEKIVFRKWSGGKFSFVDENEKDYFLRDFLSHKLFSVIGYFLPREAKAQFFQDIWEGHLTGKEIATNLDTRGLEYLEVGLKNLKEYVKKRGWDYNTRCFLAEWASWQSIKALDEKYKIFTSLLLLELDIIEKLLMRYGELKRLNRKLEAEGFLELAKGEVERTKRVLENGMEYVKSQLHKFEVEDEEWYEEVERIKEGVKEKPKVEAVIEKEKEEIREVEEKKEIYPEQILELLKEKSMTFQEIADRLEVEKEEIAPLLTKLKNDGKIELDSSFRWKIKN